MNNSQKRFVLRLMGALAIIEHNAKKHRKLWEQGKRTLQKR